MVSNYFAAANQPSVGASGAVFGLFGAMAVVGRKIGADIRSIAVIVGINFAFGFALGGVDWRAHLGGLIGEQSLQHFYFVKEGKTLSTEVIHRVENYMRVISAIS